MKAYPDMKLVVPQLGADEFEAYLRLSDRYKYLWLDTTMMLADYLPVENPPDISQMRFDRLMFGTDFPNIPYAWDRELTRLTASGLDEMAMVQILAKTAADLFEIDITGTFS